MKSFLVELEERLAHTLMPGVYRAVTGVRLEAIYDRIAREALSYYTGGPIVDVGCGGGHLLRALDRHCPRATRLGIDPAIRLLSAAGRVSAGDGAGFCGGEAGRLPLSRDSVGLLVSTGSIHHWPSFASGLEEVFRVLKPGAYACIYDQARFSGVGEAWRALRQGFVGLGLTALPTEEIRQVADASALSVARFEIEGALVRLILQKPPAAPTP